MNLFRWLTSPFRLLTVLLALYGGWHFYTDYFTAPPPITMPPPDPMATWQPPVPDAMFSLNIRGNNSKAIGRMFWLFALAEQQSVDFDILTEPSKPTEARFYFTQHSLEGKPHVTETRVTNIRHIHRDISPLLLAQSP